MAKKMDVKIENLPVRSQFSRRRKVCPFAGENTAKLSTIKTLK